MPEFEYELKARVGLETAPVFVSPAVYQAIQRVCAKAERDFDFCGLKPAEGLKVAVALRNALDDALLPKAPATVVHNKRRPEWSEKFQMAHHPEKTNPLLDPDGRLQVKKVIELLKLNQGLRVRQVMACSERE